MEHTLFSLADHALRPVFRGMGFRSRVLPTRAGRVHVYDADGRGALPPVVILHGIGASATQFGVTMRRLLADHARVLAMDLPGHGLSDPLPTTHDALELLHAVQDAMEGLVIGPHVLVGNSLGGALALQLASRSRGDALRALILLSPAGAQLSDADWDALRSRFRVHEPAAGVAFLRDLYHRPPWFVHLLGRDIPRTFARPVIRALLDTASNEMVPRAEDLRSLKVPTLFIWGASERVLPESAYRYFRATLPDHTVFERPRGWGHCPQLDAPVAVARRITAFVRSAAAS
jgi:pimeloyl-ACP methyl ester carboxylesterase